MKLSTKLILYLTCVVAILFSVFGIFMISQNFNHALDTTIKHYRNQHIMERYVVETIINTIVTGGDLTDERLIEYGASLSNYGNNNQQLAILLSDKKAIYSNLPNDINSLDITELN